jgi:NAD(P)H-nitrite reductase large subunit
MDHVIIGAGPAGVAAADTLRQVDPAATVTLLCGEAGPPYARMAIPYVMAGKIDEAGTRIKADDGHYRRHGIRLRHATVVGVDAAARRVILADGAALAYDRLLVATGSAPVRPNIPGLDLPGVHRCWTLDDMRGVCADARPGRRVALLGAGFVACIILQALVARGAEVTVVCGSSGRMVRSMMDETAGGMIMRWCRTNGVRVVAGGRPAAVAPGMVVTLETGETVETDAVLVATGVRTNTGFLAGSGVDIGEGVKVDRFLRSSVDGIYAAGDVAQGLNLSTGRQEVHAIQPTAVEHGRIAALNMAGRAVPYAGSLAMNTLDTLGLVSCSFGLWAGQDGGSQARLVDESGYRYLRLEFSGDRLVGVNAVGWGEAVGVARGLIQTRIRLGGWLDRLKKEPWRLAEAYVACAG